MNYIDKHGQPLDFEDWLKLHEDEDYCIVGRDEVGEGLGAVLVSTVWIGYAPNFETMVFSIRTGLNGDLPQIKYDTLSEAQAGHAAMVELQRNERR